MLDSLMKVKKEIVVHKEYLKGRQFGFKVLSSLTKYNDEYQTVVFENILLNEKDNIKIIKQ